ncbi:type II secretion system minor pseudopilin GspI [Methylophilus sp. 3sh_L]|uniref:type II secretion system minor pseudopilin GspI n=1 Tax=Methylophilus sp. 3sh_L TaxID=3377114 RepID=UPI00398F2455
MKHRSQFGFTLLETLVALAILAIALTSIFRALGMATLSSIEIRNRLVGNWVAENNLAELRALKAWPSPGTSEGTSEQAGYNYRWRAEVISTPNPLIRRVDIDVYAQDSSTHSVAHLSGYVSKEQM